MPLILDAIKQLEFRLLGQPTALKTRVIPAFNVPYASNPDFVDRPDIFNALKECIFQDGSHSHQPTAALFGLGGAGKSQIAIKYAYWLHAARPDTDSIFWIHGTNINRVQLAYQDIASHFCIPGADPSSPDFLQTVKNWLMQRDHGPWLMILDNIDESELFFDPSGSGLINFIPDCAHGSILITTRDRAVAAKFTRGKRGLLEVTRMSDSEARNLLSNIMDEDILDLDQVPELAKLVDHLPLALAQAGAFMQENSYTIKQYREIYASNDKDLVDTLSEDFHGQGRDSKVPSAVVATWMVSFDQIRDKHPTSADLMSLMACFDRQGIPTFLLIRAGQKLAVVEKALLPLISFSFIRPNEQRTSYQMHRLVHLVMQKWLQKCGSTKVWAENALARLSDFFSHVDKDDAQRISAVVPHTQHVLNFDCLPPSTAPERASVMHGLATYFHVSGSPRRAQELGDAALKLRQSEFGMNHAATLESMETMVSILRSLGQYQEAIGMQMQVLSWRQQNMGTAHNDTISSMNLLANLYQDLGDFDVSEKFCETVKTFRLKHLRPDHADVLSVMCDLASLYHQQHRLGLAEETYSQNERVSLKLFGPKHHRTLAIRLALSRLHMSQGHDDRAEVLLRDTLSQIKESQGVESSIAIACMCTLGDVCVTRGLVDEGLELLTEALATCKRKLGSENPTTRQITRDLAFIYWKLKRVEEPRQLLGETVRSHRWESAFQGSPFDDLIIDKTYKDMLKALVTHYQQRTRRSRKTDLESFDDGALDPNYVLAL
jgi:hypothetical protein